MMTNDERSGDSSRTEEVATLGGGCFWCLEAVFDEVRGVYKVVWLLWRHSTGSYLQAGLHRHHWPRGGRPGYLRPLSDLV